MKNRFHFTHQIAASLVLIGVVPLLQSCGSGKDVTYKSGGMTHTIAQGEGSIPKEFASFTYPESEATGSVSADGEDKEQSQFAMLTTKAGSDEVSKWYQEQLQSNGWDLGNVQTTGGVISIDAKKKDLEMNVMINAEESKTTISLSIAKASDKVPDEAESENFVPDKVAPPTD